MRGAIRARRQNVGASTAACALCKSGELAEQTQQRLKTSLKLPNRSKNGVFEGPFAADEQLTGQKRDLHGPIRPQPRP